MGLGAQVRRHPGQHDLVDPALAELEEQVVGLGPVDLVGTGDDGFAVLDVRLVPGQPVGARAGSPGIIWASGLARVGRS